MTRAGPWPLERVVEMCSVVPRGYGVSRSALYSFNVYVAPIPMNFVYGAIEWFWWRICVRGWGWGAYDDLRRSWMSHGEQKGFERGYETGIRHCAAAAKHISRDAW